MIDLERELSRYGTYLSETIPPVDPNEVEALTRKPGTPRRRRPVVIAVAAAVSILLVIGGAMLVLQPFADEPPTATAPPQPEPTTVPTTITSEPQPTQPPGPEPTTGDEVPPIGTVDGLYSLDGRLPTVFPTQPLAIAFFGEDDDPALLVAEFGTPDENALPDAATWSLPGGAWFSYNAVEIWSFAAGVPDGSPVRLGLYGGVVLGEATFGDLIEAWGEPLTWEDDGVTYTHGASLRFSSTLDPSLPLEQRRIEELRILELYYWSRFIADGMAGIEVFQECDDRGCRVRSDDAYWAPSGGVTPFFSWGTWCLGEPCEYVGMFMATAPPASVPVAADWVVQTPGGVGGFVLARAAPGDRLEIVASDVAGVGADEEVLGPFPSAADPRRFHFTIGPAEGRVETYVLDVDDLTVTRGLPPVASLAAGLRCADLHASGYAYVDAVAYWIWEGQPDRMDADRDGIPCQTVYPADAITGYWGDPLPTLHPLPAGATYQVDEPVYQVPAEPGSGGLYGSGCAAAAGTLEDGVWFGEVTSRSADAVEFDLMCFGPGPDGPGSVENSSPALRTVDVSPQARVWRMGNDGVSWALAAYRAWLVLPPSPFCAEGCFVWLYVNGGEITEVVELWFA